MVELKDDISFGLLNTASKGGREKEEGEGEKRKREEMGLVLLMENCQQKFIHIQKQQASPLLHFVELVTRRRAIPELSWAWCKGYAAWET